MPRYDYRCDSCGTEAEQSHRVNSAPEPCPSCGSAQVSKLFHAAAIQFRGTGFYVTDTR